MGQERAMYSAPTWK